jgi:TRAP-type C4-dicarboxylate transport system substrate-binding protein
VDGAENNPPTYVTHKHYEIAGYYTLTEHLIVPEIFVFSKKVWDTLPAVDQALIRKAAALTVDKERELWAAREQEALEDLRKMGVEVVTDIDKGPLIEATAGVREGFRQKYPDLLKRVEETEG